jgi:hypothetical protein
LEEEQVDTPLLDVKYSMIERVLFRLLTTKLTTVITFTLHILKENQRRFFTDDLVEILLDSLVYEYGFLLIAAAMVGFVKF